MSDNIGLLTCPIPDSYVVPGSRRAPGEYPGSEPETSPQQATKKREAFLDAAISAFTDLTDPDDGLDRYTPAIQSLASVP